MSDKSDDPLKLNGARPALSIVDFEPDLAAALRALLIIGAPQPGLFTWDSNADVDRYVSGELAGLEKWQPLWVIGESMPDLPALPLGLVLLYEPSVYEAILARFVDQFEYVALQHNQFLLFDDAERAALRGLYESFLDELELLLTLDLPDPEAGQDDPLIRPISDADNALPLPVFRDMVAGHHHRLWQHARQLLERQLGSPSPPTENTGNVADAVGKIALWAPPCHEYDAQFQLSLWGFDAEQLQGPILDLGCGENALLVHYLRQAGHEAWGLERFGGESQYVRAGDWLDTPLERGRWGTIISHMGFSNHFFHHHLRKDGHPERYARRFMEILDALKPGGRFLYAPGLPFFEPLLPEDRFRVTTYPIDVDMEGLIGTMHPSGPGGDEGRRPALYATEVRRL